jgi:ubiquinone biosynthesis protein
MSDAREVERGTRQAGDASAEAGASLGASEHRPLPSDDSALRPVVPDQVHGAFSDSPPWLVDPARLTWLAAARLRREEARRELPGLLERRRIPPGLRVVEVLLRVGRAVGAWAVVERRSGDRSRSRAGLSRRLRLAFERLGPTYIKLGQILSSGEGLFPPELVSEFRLLRDQVPPEPFSSVRRVVEEDLGRPLEEVFVHFDREPIAAASIAQVHAARLASGEEVVVKVQREHVASLVRKDLAAMSWIAPILVGRIPVAALANPPALVELFAETIVEELDFRLEAENMLDLARVFAASSSKAIVVPRPHPELVTRRVLVMERLDGFAWGDAERMRQAGIDTEEVLRAGLLAFLEGVLLHGVFHGDLHGGNLFVRPDGTVALLDYGITGRLGEARRRAFLRLLVAGTANDVRGQVEAIRDLGALPADVDVDAVIRDLGLDRPPLDPTKLTAEELTAQIREVTKALLGYGARMPKELMLFVKDLLFLDGALALMAPDIDLLAEVLRIVAWFHEHHGERIAREIGLDPDAEPIVDLDAVRGALGVTDPVDRLTYRELAARRELIRRRFERRETRRLPRAARRLRRRGQP